MTDNFEVPEDFRSFAEEIDEDAAYDAAQLVSIRSTVGRDFDVIIDEPMSIADVLRRGSLAVGQDVEFYVDGARVDATFVVGPGAIVNAVGMVKGGA